MAGAARSVDELSSLFASNRPHTRAVGGIFMMGFYAFAFWNTAHTDGKWSEIGPRMSPAEQTHALLLGVQVASQAAPAVYGGVRQFGRLLFQTSPEADSLRSLSQHPRAGHKRRPLTGSFG